MQKVFGLLPIIDRLILKTFLRYYVSVLGVFTFLLFIIGLAIGFGWVAGKNIGLKAYGLAFLYFSGQVGITLFVAPAMLGGATLAMVHLNSNYELLAMKGMGMSLWRVMQPLVLFFMVVSPGVFGLYGYVAPWAGARLARLGVDVAKNQPTHLVRPGTLQDIGGYKVFIGKDEGDGKHIQEVLIYEEDGVIVSRAGKVTTLQDGSVVITLQDGAMYRQDEESVFTQRKLWLKEGMLAGKVPLDVHVELMDRTALAAKQDALCASVQKRENAFKTDVMDKKTYEDYVAEKKLLAYISWLRALHWMYLVASLLFLCLGCALGALTRDGRALLVTIIGFGIGVLHRIVVLWSISLFWYVGVEAAWLGNALLAVLLILFGVLASRDTTVLGWPSRWKKWGRYFYRNKKRQQ